LHLQEIADPLVKENDVLVRVYSAGVNLLDSKIKNGEFKLILPYKTPLVLGHDVAGVITKTGARVSRFKVGDEVYARPADHRIGTFAELIAVNQADVALKPQKLTMEEAAPNTSVPP
jgi:alcohol dehydrogenase